MPETQNRETTVPSHKKLINDIDEYLTKTGMKAYDFGKKFLNDSGAITRIRQGNNPRLSTVQKIYDIIGVK